jgi:hypothetical protein
LWSGASNRRGKWFDCAKPQLIDHVVFGYKDFEGAAKFYRDRLTFRVTDVARGRGLFMRADGRSDHHNIFWIRSEEPASYLSRSGARTSMSCLPVPTTCNVKSGPASLDLAGTAYLRPFISISRAQQVEKHSADTDFLDDRLQPRFWGPLFGKQHWIADLPEFLTKRPDEDVRLLAEKQSELVNMADSSRSLEPRGRCRF